MIAAVVEGSIAIGITVASSGPTFEGSSHPLGRWVVPLTHSSPT